MSPNHNPKYKLLILRLKQARQATGLTQAAVAQRLGLRQSVISKIEANERTLDPVELWELARVYGQSVTDLLNFVEDGEAAEPIEGNPGDQARD